MATDSETSAVGSAPAVLIPPLEAGDRLSRAEFERRYEAMPHLKKAELIEGVVYVPPPVSPDHGDFDSIFNGLLLCYASVTPGTRSGINATVRLGQDSEPQPDGHLRIEPQCGGQMRIGTKRYLEGPPELISEIASSSVSYDLHAKLELYRRSGVREYVVWRVLDKQIDWFVLREGQYKPLAADVSGIYRSEVFPGLWFDPSAALRGDTRTMLATLQLGLASKEHADFVVRLREAAEGKTESQ
jgi:Uma2 family endonuclease